MKRAIKKPKLQPEQPPTAPTPEPTGMTPDGARAALQELWGMGGKHAGHTVAEILTSDAQYFQWFLRETEADRKKRKLREVFAALGIDPNNPRMPAP